MKKLLVLLSFAVTLLVLSGCSSNTTPADEAMYAPTPAPEEMTAPISHHKHKYRHRRHDFKGEMK